MELRAAVNGTELHYALHGAGRPLVTMHGGLGLDHEYLRPWLDPLGDAAQLVFYDHRGHGRSARVSLDTVGHATWADDADALRVHLGHERVVLFGHAYGGYLAQEYALRYPDQVAGLILCSTAPAFDYRPVVLANAQARGTPEQLAIVQAMGAHGHFDDQSFRRGWMTLLPLYFKRFNPEIAVAMDRATRYSGAGFVRGVQCLQTFNTVARLGEIKCPTLILAGAHDWIAPPAEGAERLRAGIAGAELALFESSGHFPFIEEAERFQTVVREWLGKLAPVG